MYKTIPGNHNYKISLSGEIVTKAKSFYPGMKIEIEDLYTTGSVQAYHVKSGKITESVSVRELSRTIDRSFASILYAIKNGTLISPMVSIAQSAFWL